MIAWKFLRRGAISPLTRFAWPVPDNGQEARWVEARAPLVGCRSGFHACRREDLACWICDELWEVELEGTTVDAIDAIVAPRARLIRRIESWEAEGGTRFLEFCVSQAERAFASATPEGRDRMRPFLDTTTKCAKAGNKAVGSYSSASVLGVLVSGIEEQARIFREERARQSEWIASQLLTK